MDKEPGKKYSKADIEKIRRRAEEIWRAKRASLQTAIDDWLQAERELKAQLAIENKPADQYTERERNLIKSRAEALRAEKVLSLETAFNDWIEAEQELKDELQGRLRLEDLFPAWFKRVSADMERLMEAEDEMASRRSYDICCEHYVDLMAESMK